MDVKPNNKQTYLNPKTSHFLVIGLFIESVPSKKTFVKSTQGLFSLFFLITAALKIKK